MPTFCHRLLPALALLAGCAGGPTIPERVEIPVPVPCLASAPERPALRADDEIKGMDDYRATAALLAERRKLQGYVKTLEAAVEGCR